MAIDAQVSHVVPESPDFRKKATRQRATVHSPKRIHGAQKTALVLDWLINLIFEHILYKYLIPKRTIYYHERIQKFCSGEGGPRHTFGNFTIQI